MRVKFNKYETVAGLFVVGAIVGILLCVVGFAVKRGWFESKVKFHTMVESADGLRRGTVVQMEGLKAGSITQIELRAQRKIRVEFEVSEDFYDKIRSDTVIRVVRPFVIGEKVLDLSIGSEDQQKVDPEAFIASESSMDLMDLLNGKRLAPFVDSMTKIMENLKYVADAFLDKKRSHDFVEIYDQLKPLLVNMNRTMGEVHTLSYSLNKDQRMVKILVGLNDATRQLNRFLPEVADRAPALSKNVAELTEHLNILVGELNVFMPMVREMGPELPKVGKRAAEALDETVVTLKALQKTFILKGASQEVRQEEKTMLRTPAKEGNSK